MSYHWIVVNEDIDISVYVKDAWKKGNLIFINIHYPGHDDIQCTRENARIIASLSTNVTVSNSL